jgi:predicted ATPase
MIESITFENFRVLRSTTLPLGPFTLIIGPNNSGKSTALQALEEFAKPTGLQFADVASVGLTASPPTHVALEIHWAPPRSELLTVLEWVPARKVVRKHERADSARGDGIDRDAQELLDRTLRSCRVYALDAPAIARYVQIQPSLELQSDGSGLAGVIEGLRERDPERFDALNSEVARWLGEFDRILFEVPHPGHKGVLLRTREGHYQIRARDLSQGTLLALALLTLAYLPDPPPIIALEEPDRGIHPCLLREVRDAIYRLSYPDAFGERRKPVQVIATTHSPYMLDLFREHPEEVVVASKVGNEAKFQRLVDHPQIDEILAHAPLGEVWYSGILGGVPTDK